MRAFAAVVAALALTRCAGSARLPPRPSSPPGVGLPTADEFFVRAPMQLVRVAPGATEPLLSLARDGSVTAGGDLVARFVGDRLLGPSGATLLHGAADAGELLRWLPGGDLQGPRGTVLHVDDDGATVIRDARGEAERGPWRVAGFEPRARTTAVALVYLALLRERSPPPAGSYTPAP